MKTSITVGASLLVLSAAPVLRNAASDSACASKATLPLVQSERSAKTTRAGRMNFRAVVPTLPDPPIRADLLAALESETDPDRQSEALDHAVESVFQIRSCQGY